MRILAPLLLTLVGSAGPAQAATRHLSADLNGDGVPDLAVEAVARGVVESISASTVRTSFSAAHDSVARIRPSPMSVVPSDKATS